MFDEIFLCYVLMKIESKLAACFLDGFSPPQGPWMMVGIGLRVMQDVGAHRRRFTGKKSLENELWKRCFWVLVIMDRTFSNLLGRSCAIQDEEYVSICLTLRENSRW
jgi:hypothetical protein